MVDSHIAEAQFVRRFNRLEGFSDMPRTYFDLQKLAHKAFSPGKFMQSARFMDQAVAAYPVHLTHGNLGRWEVRNLMDIAASYRLAASRRGNR